MPKIIDAFPFFNELDALEIRLNELACVVDTFVIVESLEVHGAAHKKPANLAANWERFKQFEHQIKYVVLEHLEPPFDANARGHDWMVNLTAWGRENFQRKSLLAPVLEVSTSPDDFVIVSDADEIPSADAVRRALPQVAARGIHQLALDFFYYNVNCCISKKWARSTIGTVAQYQREGGFQVARDSGGGSGAGVGGKYPWIENAGWHFSYFGHDVDKMRYKVSSVAQAQHRREVELLARTPEQVKQDMDNCFDVFHDDTMPMTRRETLDPRLPAHFLNNIERFRHCTDGK